MEQPIGTQWQQLRHRKARVLPLWRGEHLREALSSERSVKELPVKLQLRRRYAVTRLLVAL
jgi:hypothetical protein